MAPLSPAVPRRHLHTREVDCRGYLREDGLWDIEAEVLDTKTYRFDNHWRGDVEPGVPVHRMRLRLTVDDRLVVVGAEAATLDSPYQVCALAADNFSRLVGLRIGPGWMRLVKERYGRAAGCTHILELLHPLATTAYQTVMPYREHERRRAGMSEAEAMDRGPGINSCLAFGESSPVVKLLWPEKYREAVEGSPVPK